MTRGTCGDESCLAVPGLECLHGGNTRPCGSQRRLPGSSAHMRVTVQMSPSGCAEALDGVDVPLVMDKSEHAFLGARRFAAHDLQTGREHTLDDGAEPFRALGMTAPGVMIESRIVGSGAQIASQHHRTGNGSVFRG